jgi:hypothetical protein
MQEYKIKLALTVIAIILFIDIYSWHGVKQLVQNKSIQTKRWVRIIWWATPILLLSLFIASNLIIALQTNTRFRVYLSASIFMLYLSKLILLLFVFIDDLRRLFIWLLRKTKSTPEVNPTSTEAEISTNTITRSQFLAQAGTITAAVPFIMLSKGIFKGGYDYQIHRVPLYIKNLPSAFHGLKVAQYVAYVLTNF